MFYVQMMVNVLRSNDAEHFEDWMTLKVLRSGDTE